MANRHHLPPGSQWRPINGAEVELDESPTDLETVAKYKQLISEIYRQKNPSKLVDIEFLFEKYKGREEVLYYGVCTKYQVEPNVPSNDASYDDLIGQRSENGAAILAYRQRLDDQLGIIARHKKFITAAEITAQSIRTDLDAAEQRYAIIEQALQGQGMVNNDGYHVGPGEISGVPVHDMDDEGAMENAAKYHHAAVLLMHAKENMASAKRNLDLAHTKCDDIKRHKNIPRWAHHVYDPATDASSNDGTIGHQ